MRCLKTGSISLVVDQDSKILVVVEIDVHLRPKVKTDSKR